MPSTMVVNCNLYQFVCEFKQVLLTMVSTVICQPLRSTASNQPCGMAQVSRIIKETGLDESGRNFKRIHWDVFRFAICFNASAEHFPNVATILVRRGTLFSEQGIIFDYLTSHIYRRYCPVHKRCRIGQVFMVVMQSVTTPSSSTPRYKSPPSAIGKRNGVNDFTVRQLVGRF